MTMRVLLFFTCFMVLNSCDNDLDLVADYKDIPVVYALVNPSDTAQYFRVERVFVDPETSALEIAQNPDSLYYENLSVQLIRPNGNAVSLERVDGNQEGFVREEGVFASSPNILYKVKTSELGALQDGNQIDLQIDRQDESPLITATTTIVGETDLLFPRSETNITFEYDRDILFRWKGSSSAEIYNVTMLMYVQEFDGSELTEKVLTYPIAKNVTDQEFEFLGLNFFSFLASNLDPDPNIIARFFNGIDVIVTAGGSELAQIVRLNLANTGITSSQAIPTFSNVSEGLGIFTAIDQTVERGFGIAPITRDSLINSVLLSGYNFM